VDRLDQPEEALSAELDRVECILAQKDAEIRRLKSELELRGLYVEQLHAALEAQASELAALDDRLQRLEPAESAVDPWRTLLRLPIRVKKAS
jgi:chromosome segregation ATPase